MQPTIFQSLTQSPFVRQLSALLVIVIVIGFAYAAVPIEYELVRSLIGYVQLAFMAATMWVAIRKYLEEF